MNYQTIPYVPDPVASKPVERWDGPFSTVYDFEKSKAEEIEAFSVELTEKYWVGRVIDRTVVAHLQRPEAKRLDLGKQVVKLLKALQSLASEGRKAYDKVIGLPQLERE